MASKLSAPLLRPLRTLSRMNSDVSSMGRRKVGITSTVCGISACSSAGSSAIYAKGFAVEPTRSVAVFGWTTSGWNNGYQVFHVGQTSSGDVQFAAAVAYYYRFEAPQAKRKDAINKDDLQEATRKATRDRFGNPLKTLQNAHQLGRLDKGSEKATFTINSVGENLVAMTLPGDSTNSAKEGREEDGQENSNKSTGQENCKKKA